MLGLRSLFGFAFLIAWLSTLIAAAAAGNVPRTLRQANRGDVVERMKLSSGDGTWTARKSKRSTSSPPPCTPGDVPAAGLCGCDFTVMCQTHFVTGTVMDTFTASTFAACLAACQNRFGCYTMDYLFTTGTCTFYSDTSALTEDVNYQAAVVDGYVCNGPC